MELKEFLQDPMFYGLIWAILAVAGIVIGWTLRANFPEKDVRQHLIRTEQERNTLARLYTHLKHQYDLREADFRRSSLEAGNLQERLRSMEMEKAGLAAAHQAAANRMERAEAHALQYGEKVVALEQQAQTLRTRDTELAAEMAKALEELTAWRTLYRDFQRMQQKLATFEQASRTLEAERNRLQLDLANAKTDIDKLQAQLTRQISLPGKQTNVRKGGTTATEQLDDLKNIRNISLALQQQLHQLGISTFLQIHRWDDDAVINHARKLNISPAKIFQEDWVSQARQLSAGYRP